MDLEICQQYLRIFHSHSVGVSVFSRLLKEFGTLRRLVSLSESALSALGLSCGQIETVLSPVSSVGVEKQIDADLEWNSRPENSIVYYEDEDYPKLLQEIDSAPPLLYVTGSLSTLAATNFSIVGSRKASSYGRRNAYWIAQELSAAGLQICSGLALGVDTQAHRGALDSNATTIAVMGTGADRIYPVTNAGLAKRISENGALVSEFPLGVAPRAENFPRRNRIISGLSLGTLVVEANARSGSLITSRFAMEQNREVFAFPGPITNQQCRGCHHLIKQGASLVEEPVDILEELGINHPLVSAENSGIKAVKNQAPSLSAKGRLVLNTIGDQGSLFQSILDDSKLDVQELNLHLMQLEMAALIYLEGGRYYRVC